MSVPIPGVSPQEHLVAESAFREVSDLLDEVNATFQLLRNALDHPINNFNNGLLCPAHRVRCESDFRPNSTEDI